MKSVFETLKAKHDELTKAIASAVNDFLRKADGKRLEFDDPVKLETIDDQLDSFATAIELHGHETILLDVEIADSLYDEFFDNLDIPKQLKILKAIETAMKEE